MSDSYVFLPSRGEVQARYEVRLLADARPTPEGLVHRTADGEQHVAWSVLRFDEEPGEDAEAVAEILAAAIPTERLGAAVKSLASESVVAEWFPDVPTFEETALALLQRRLR